MITIINYGLGNIHAFVSLFERMNVRINIADKAEHIKNSVKLILPGVGAFDQAMTLLNNSGMRDELDKQVLINKKPVIGVCVGMQILAKTSEEGKMSGLGWIDAHVKRFDEKLLSGKTHLPHMGWNDVAPVNDSSIFNGIINPKYYFLHSYYMVPEKKENILSVTKYNIEFTSAVHSENVYGTQFHPEKSHQWGVKLLYNFSKI